MNMMKKLVLAVAVAAVAVSFAPTLSHAKKMKKAKPASCTVGTMCTGAANAWGWAPVMSCGADGKLYPWPAACYVKSGLCAKAC